MHLTNHRAAPSTHRPTSRLLRSLSLRNPRSLLPPSISLIPSIPPSRAPERARSLEGGNDSRSEISAKTSRPVAAAAGDKKCPWRARDLSHYFLGLPIFEFSSHGPRDLVRVGSTKRIGPNGARKKCANGKKMSARLNTEPPSRPPSLPHPLLHPRTSAAITFIPIC